MFVMTTMRAPNGAGVPLMSKNQTVFHFFVQRGFHAVKTRT